MSKDACQQQLSPPGPVGSMAGLGMRPPPCLGRPPAHKTLGRRDSTAAQRQGLGDPCKVAFRLHVCHAGFAPGTCPSPVSRAGFQGTSKAKREMYDLPVCCLLFPPWFSPCFLPSSIFSSLFITLRHPLSHSFSLFKHPVSSSLLSGLLSATSLSSCSARICYIPRRVLGVLVETRDEVGGLQALRGCPAHAVREC